MNDVLKQVLKHATYIHCKGTFMSKILLFNTCDSERMYVWNKNVVPPFVIRRHWYSGHEVTYYR